MRGEVREKLREEGVGGDWTLSLRVLLSLAHTLARLLPSG